MKTEADIHVQYDSIEDDIGVIRLNNGRDNKIEEADFLNLSEFNMWLDEHRFRGLIITGNGRNFSKGANVLNIKKYKEHTENLEKKLNQGKRILTFIENLPIVTVAAINGACFGAGLEIALSCDYRLAAANALFAFPESGLGIMPGLGGTVRLPALIGLKAAKKIILSGEIVSCEKAHEIGLVDAVTEKGEVLLKAEKLLRELTDNRSLKQLEYISDSLKPQLKDNWLRYENESKYFVDLVKTMETGHER